MSMRQRHGSALLVVLGMVAFMVVSAVAFSAYMRHSRLPSSFLRQTAATRLLVKAALANAIDEIDSAIGNNPHPNVGTTAYMYPRDQGQSWQRNSWIGRVYMGTNTTSVSASEDETVSTLNLEALAYLPPPLVNEVRYYSRRSRAGCWHRMNFDAGRYAFCAVDVSDYFDINALEADAPRSSEPGSRITLSYLFEDGKLGTASAWDSFMEPYRGNTKVPLVSIADWNLAMNNGGPFKTPFCNYVENGPGNFYNLTSETGEEADRIRAMTFVTDGYFPPESASSGDRRLDLAEDGNQPWKESDLRSWRAGACRNALAPADESEGFKRLYDHIPDVARAALYDYLDEDRIPTSLALPTIERAPMLCGLEVLFNGATLAVKETIDSEQKYKYEPADYKNSATRETTKTLRYGLDGSKLNLANVQVSALVTYPFRHHDEVEVGTYKIDGAMLIFLTSEEMGLRPENAVDRLKLLDENFFSGVGSVKDGVIVLPLSGGTVGSEFNKNMQTEREAVTVVTFPPPNVGSVVSDLGLEDNALLTAVLKCTQTAKPIDPEDLTKGYDWTNPTPSDDDIDNVGEVQSAECRFKAFAANGQVAGAYQKIGSELMTAYRGAGSDLRLNVAVVVRIVKDGKVVDMVPACVACDDVFNRTQNGSDLAGDCIRAVGGGGTPLLRFDTGATFKWSRQGFADSMQAPAAASVSPKTILVGDPRYNYAPESWFSFDGGLEEQQWLDNCGAHEADGDIFMQTSDQCRLQSVYELANLPRVGKNGLNEQGDDVFRGMLREPESVSRKTIGTKDQALNRDFMWKSYDPFGRYQDGGDGFQRLRLVSDGVGFKVNPYSDSTNIIMAAFANTPHDWRCASVDNKEITADSASAFNAKYAWNENSSGAKLNWANLEEVAGELMSEVRSNPSGTEYEESWESALRNLGWRSAAGGAGSENYILDGLDLDGGCKVFNTDRKFLYGFWHDCFASRQQLFLVFVRAEPVMMGGGAIGQTPPQLGGRAVALVWRDPKATSTANAPHRTRVLFYRQFD